MIEIDPDAETFFDTAEEHSMVPVSIALKLFSSNPVA